MELFFFTLLSDYIGVPRPYYGFDSFEGFPDPVEMAKTAPITGKEFLANPPATVLKVLKDGPEGDDVIDKRIRLVKGWFDQTLPAYHGHIALLHLDGDLYESYKVPLETLYDKVQPGGIIMFDEYRDKRWPGVSKAIDEFSATSKMHLEILRRQTVSLIGELLDVKEACCRTENLKRMKKKPVLCFLTFSAGDWGGASRVLFTNLRLMDRDRLTPLLLLPRIGPIEPELRQLKLRYLIWGPLTEPGKPTAYLRSFFRAWLFFRREHVAVIHVNSSNFWRPAELLAARLLGIPILAHYHVINDQPAPAMAWCQAAIAVSRYTAEQSLPTRMYKPVIYSPISLDRFDAGHSLREELGLSESGIVVAFLGQIREIKGVADFIAMARQIPNPDVRFLIAGECRDPNKYTGSYSERDLKDMAGGDARIRYVGYVKEVANVYHTADIVVVPSRWQEPLGLINLEAGACRKPVVATRMGGIPEVVEDGVNGYLVEAGDVEALTDRVSRLIADSALRSRMGEAGRARVEQDFTTRPVREFETLLLRYVRR